MIISVESQAERHVLKLQGRFDANWSDLVANAIEAAIRGGHHDIDLDFAEVSYISSAGIRILLKYAKQLKAARGALCVVRPTDAILSVFRLSGLTGILLRAAGTAEVTTAPEPAATALAQAEPHRWQRDGTNFESYTLSGAAKLEAEVVGRPEAFARGQLSAAESYRLRCTTDALALGLGAFGRHPGETQNRLGESLAIAGVAVTLPTDGSSVADYQLTEGELVPELNLLYGWVA